MRNISGAVGNSTANLGHFFRTVESFVRHESLSNERKRAIRIQKNAHISHTRFRSDRTKYSQELVGAVELPKNGNSFIFLLDLKACSVEKTANNMFSTQFLCIVGIKFLIDFFPRPTFFHSSTANSHFSLSFLTCLASITIGIVLCVHFF